MSFFGKIFGGKKGDKAPTTGEAIQKLRETEEMLIKKQEFLEKKIELELDVARKNAKTNKRAALQVWILLSFLSNFNEITRVIEESRASYVTSYHTFIEIFKWSLWPSKHFKILAVWTTSSVAIPKILFEFVRSRHRAR